jgi:hypothetical protein
VRGKSLFVPPVEVQSSLAAQASGEEASGSSNNCKDKKTRKPAMTTFIVTPPLRPSERSRAGCKPDPPSSEILVRLYALCAYKFL